MEEYWWWKYGKKHNNFHIFNQYGSPSIQSSQHHHEHIDPIIFILIMSLCLSVHILSSEVSRNHWKISWSLVNRSSPQLSNGWYSSYNCCFGRQGEEVERWLWQKKKLRQFSFSKEFIWHVQNIHHLPKQLLAIAKNTILRYKHIEWRLRGEVCIKV